MIENGMRLNNRKNAMSIDVEDYFQVAAFKNNIDTSQWDAIACRVERNMDVVMAALDRNKVRATFFTLGWIAKRYPQMVRSIVDQGHELASHGYGHQMISDMNPKSFENDIRCAKAILEDTSGTAVCGYRAPSFSITRTTLWAHEILAETGHTYSSSVYPIAHDLYGIPDAPRFAYQVNETLVEIPATSIRIGQRNFPASGGGFFRLFPLSLSKAIIAKVNRDDKQAAIFYCHPWEFDPDQPRVANASAKSRFRHYVNLKSNAAKFDNLLSAFNWAPMRDVFVTNVSATHAPATAE